jgi:hypothetical protein
VREYGTRNTVVRRGEVLRLKLVFSPATRILRIGCRPSEAPEKAKSHERLFDVAGG